MRYILWIISASAVLLILHRIGLWAEKRGWIYYKNRKCNSGAIGNAFLELQAFLEPSKRHIAEERKKVKTEVRESGDKPQAG